MEALHKEQVEKAIKSAISEHEYALTYFKTGDVGIVAWIAEDANLLLKKENIGFDITFLKELIKQELKKLLELEKISVVWN